MGLRDIGARLPPGFRFYPSDEELVCHYLCKKVANEDALRATSLLEIDLHTCEPWQLPEVAKLNNTEWYFFSFRDRKYATGFRTNRATTSGYWKATGKDRVILEPRTREIVGMRKTLVFYRNRAPNGIKTGWIMHEFRLESPNMPPKEDWVLCRVFHKSKEDSNSNANSSNQQIMVDHQTHTGNAMAITSNSPPLPFNNLANVSSPTVPPPITTTTWVSSSSSLCQQQQQDPTNSLVSSTIIPSSSSTSQKLPQICTHKNTTFISSSSLSLNPNYNQDEDQHHDLIIKEAGIISSSNNFSSFSDLINSNAMNDDDYGFLWDMDLDQAETTNINNACSNFQLQLGDNHHQGSAKTAVHDDDDDHVLIPQRYHDLREVRFDGDHHHQIY